MAVNVRQPGSTAAGALSGFARYSDLFIAGAAVVIVGMMILPLPHWMLDGLLCLNITLALVVLLVTMYTSEPLGFASFPSLLLLITLFRLALSISATRLILLHGSAGGVIAAFGQVVVGGNYVVGLVIFALLVIIQFVVITNGAGRVAEVAARFTLDAMPGKQMAIDADLNAGIIDEAEGQRRRVNVAREADFYGAMDGASKFVRGDAIAAIIMIIVTILGGIGVGMVNRSGQFDIVGVLQTYTLLTVGMGIATQIPALIVSTATGLMVTKAASEHSLGWELVSQVFSQPKAIAVTAVIFALIALVPGIPKVPFLLVAGMTGLAAHFLSQNAKQAQQAAADAAAQGPSDAPQAPENMVDLIGVDTLELEIGYGLIPIADPKQGGELLERITMVRRQAALDLGLVVPAIRVRDDIQLGANQYCFNLRGVEIGRGEVFPGQLLAMNPGSATGTLRGAQTLEPAFGLPAVWISEATRSEAEVAGYTVVDPVTVLITHLTEIVRKHAAELISRQDTQSLLDAVKETSPAVVEELTPALLTVGEIQSVLANLLAERVSIRDMATILETLADFARLTKDSDVLTEYVRQRLSRSICRQYAADSGSLSVFTLHPELEQTLADNIRQTELGSRLVLEPGLVQQVLEAASPAVQKHADLGKHPVALCSARIRPHFKRLTEHSFPMLAVLSYNEIDSTVQVETTGVVKLNHADQELQS